MSDHCLERYFREVAGEWAVTLPEKVSLDELTVRFDTVLAEAERRQARSMVQEIMAISTDPMRDIVPFLTHTPVSREAAMLWLADHPLETGS